jgi:transcriptional regulator with XRE-family HTH domain
MPPLKETSPLRRKLGIELRLLREAAKLTADEAAAALETSASTISRSETGKVNVHPRDVDAMLRLYGLTDDRKREALVAIARKSRERGWWHEFRSVVSGDLANYMSIEYGASSIRIFQTLLIPGLLQTKEYTRHVAAVFPREHTPETVEQLMQIRLRRQEMLLHKPEPVPLEVVLDESVLHRPIGGPGVMRDQLRRLLELSNRDTITLQILPYDVGAHIGLGGPFTMFGFAEPMDLDIVHVENHVNFILVDDSDDIRHYEIVWEHVKREALAEADSLALVDEIAKGL